MKQSTVLHIPFPIHAQFKELAQRRDKTMVQLIADVVHQAIEAGELPDETPGFLITAADNAVHFYALRDPHGSDCLAIMDPEGAESLADTIETVSTTRMLAHVTESGVLAVRRKGTGVSLEPDVNNPNRSHVVAPIVALGLARQLRKAAAAATEQIRKSALQLSA